MSERVLKSTLRSDSSLGVSDSPGMLTVKAPSAEQPDSPYHMVASGLASCVYGILTSWAETFSLDAAGLAVRVSWSFEDKPHRVGRFASSAPRLFGSSGAPHNIFSHKPTQHFTQHSSIRSTVKFRITRVA